METNQEPLNNGMSPKFSLTQTSRKESTQMAVGEGFEGVARSHLLYTSPDKVNKRKHLSSLMKENENAERNLEARQQYLDLMNELDTAKLNFLECNRERI